MDETASSPGSAPLTSLARLGWDDGWARAYARVAGRARAELQPGRVSRVDRGGGTVLVGDGARRVSCGAPVLDAMAGDPTLGPCTGDWCVVRTWPDGPATIEALLPRRSAVRRADAGGSSRGQVLAANLDTALVVFGLHPEPVLTRVERLVTLAWASGAEPCVVLTKADLVRDAEDIAAEVADTAPGASVLACSVVTGEGVDTVRALAAGNRTLGLLGASGSGKSSLVNALAGARVLDTREIRADGRGRHTSARRELVPLPGGGAAVDTPGLRGIGLTDADDGLAATFADVVQLAAGCKFRDCGHTAEPGCAVTEAVAAGRLAVRRLDSWRKLRREQEWMAARAVARRRRRR